MNKSQREQSYYESMIQHIKNCGLGMIGGQPQPLGILLYEVEEKIIIDSSWGEFEEPALAAREKVLSVLHASQKKAHSSINFEEDITGPTNEQLTEISKLASIQQRQEADVEKLEGLLKTAKKALRKTSEDDLPGAMQAAGMEEFKTITGLTVKVKETLYASIPKARKPSAIAWLLDHAQSALIKEDVIIPFDKGDHDRMSALTASLEEGGYTVVINETINTGSIKAMIKEMLENGQDVPLDTFGAYFHTRSEIKTS